MTTTQLSRTELKKELISLIAHKWQVEEQELLLRFDPLVMMLVDVVVESIYKVNAHWDVAYHQVVNYIVRQYLPQYSNEAYPYTVVLSALPVEATLKIDEQLEVRIQNELNNAPIAYLAPVYEMNLLPVRLSEYICVPKSGMEHLTDNWIWILTKDSELIDLYGWTVFMDLPDNKNSALLQYAIRHAVFSANGKVLKFTNGITNRTTFHKEQEEILSSYQPQFLHCSDVAEIPLCNDELLVALKSNGVIPEHPLSQIIILECQLPILVPIDALKVTKVVSNAFVAINKQTVSVQHTVEDWVNLIPMPFKGKFLNIANVVGSAQKSYKNQINSQDQKIEEGNYVLKLAEQGQWSSAQLKHQLQLVQEEISKSSAYYDLVSNDFLVQQLKEIQKTLYRIDDKLQGAAHLQNEVHYLALKPYKQDKYVTVAYKISQPESLPLLRKKLVLSTTGAAIASLSIRMHTQPYVLKMGQVATPLSIQTKYDLRLICQQVLGDKFKDVTINRTWKASEVQAHVVGMQLEIYVHMTNDYDPEFFNMDRNRLAYLLEEYGALQFPFQLIFNYS